MESSRWRRVPQQVAAVERIGRESEVHHQELEIGSRANRIEIGVGLYQAEVGITGGASFVQGRHGSVGRGSRVGCRQTGSRDESNASQQGLVARDVVMTADFRDRGTFLIDTQLPNQ
jgi:hypothetical protein